MIFDEYFEELENVPFEQALNNMKEHSRNSDYFPTIAVLCKKPEQSDSPYADYKQRAQDHILYLEDVRSKAIKMPKHLKEQVEQHE